MDTNLFIKALHQYRPLAINVTFIDDGKVKDGYQFIKEAALSFKIEDVKELLLAFQRNRIMELSEADIVVIVSIYNQLENERRIQEESMHKTMYRALIMEALNHHRTSVNSDIMDEDEDQTMRMINSMLVRDISRHKCLRDLLIDYNHKQILRLNDDDTDTIVNEYNLLVEVNKKHKRK